ncbi:proline rich transmembrane protein 1B-like [Sardina pilchardus]|uniref:proline rich transmembrane protein 1B-like n=1 Tax=Sardina pilchardus TaxID=27697 RepID=UPI002E143566
MEAPRPKVESHMIWSIITTLCCCLPLGIGAIVCSRRVDMANLDGDMARAEEASRKAKILNIVGMVFGILMIAIVIVLQVVQFMHLKNLKKN